jgi:hypothetical protein
MSFPASHTPPDQAQLVCFPSLSVTQIVISFITKLDCSLFLPLCLPLYLLWHSRTKNTQSMLGHVMCGSAFLHIHRTVQAPCSTISTGMFKFLAKQYPLQNCSSSLQNHINRTVQFTSSWQNYIHRTVQAPCRTISNAELFKFAEQYSQDCSSS